MKMKYIVFLIFCCGIELFSSEKMTTEQLKLSEAEVPPQILLVKNFLDRITDDNFFYQKDDKEFFFEFALDDFYKNFSDDKKISFGMYLKYKLREKLAGKRKIINFSHAHENAFLIKGKETGWRYYRPEFGVLVKFFGNHDGYIEPDLIMSFDLFTRSGYSHFMQLKDDKDKYKELKIHMIGITIGNESLQKFLGFERKDRNRFSLSENEKSIFIEWLESEPVLQNAI